MTDPDENDEREPERSDPTPTDRGSSARVEGFFGELLDSASVDHPITRRELVEALARVDEAVRADPSPVGVDPDGKPEIPGQVVRIDRPAWRELTADCGLSDAESRAVLAVHRRMAAALVGDDSDDRRSISLVLTPKRRD